MAKSTTKPVPEAKAPAGKPNKSTNGKGGSPTGGAGTGKKAAGARKR